MEYVSEDYGEIAEILNRHKTLKSANEDLKTRQKDTSTENEEKRAEFTSNVKVCLPFNSGEDWRFLFFFGAGWGVGWGGGLGNYTKTCQEKSLLWIRQKKDFFLT